MKNQNILKLIFIFFITLTNSMAKDIAFVLKSKEVEIDKATLRLICDDKKPLKTWLSQGHAGSKTRMGEEIELDIEKLENDNYRFIIKDEVKFPNKHLLFTKCFANLNFQGMEKQTGLTLESSVYSFISRNRYWTALPTRKLSKLSKVISTLNLEICSNEKARVDRNILFCQNGKIYNPRMY